MLNSASILKLINKKQLITGYIDLKKQLQPSGFDISLKEVREYLSAGKVDFNNEERVIAETRSLSIDREGWYYL